MSGTGAASGTWTSECLTSIETFAGEVSAGSIQGVTLATENRAMGSVLELVLALHTRGWHHRDLYLHHVLIDADGGLVLIDLGRARRPRWVRRRWFAKDLAALLLWTPPEVGVRHRLRFLAKYLDAMEITSRRARRRFAEYVARRRAQMARHVPRHGETEPWEVPG